MSDKLDLNLNSLDESTIEALKQMIDNKVSLDKDLLNSIINSDKKNRAIQSILKESKSKYNKLIEMYDKLQEEYDTFIAVKELQKEIKIPILEIEPPSKNKSEAVPVIQFSDWHVGEKVELSSVGNLNEYNDKIAKLRVKKLVRNTVALLKKEDRFSHINNVVIHLGGDFINGWLHEEDIESSYMTPIEEIYFALELLIYTVEHLLHYTKYNYSFVCNVGNHGRTTKRYRYGNEVQTSYETMLYSSLADHFKNEKRVKVNLPTSGIAYADILGHKYRFIHGHQVKYQGGVGGITIPLNKYTMRLDQTSVNAAVHTFLGHFHQWSFPSTVTTMNGSLVGFNPYALVHGFKYEPPIQSFQIVHSKYGLTSKHGIHCE